MPFLASVRSLFKGGFSQDNLFALRLFWGTLAGCFIAIILAESSWLRMLELSTLEWRYRVADEISWTISRNLKSDVVVVAFDDASQFDLGIARFSDSKSQDILARVINVLEEGQPALVAVDLDLRGAANKQLVDCLRSCRNIVIALFGRLDGGSTFPSGDLLGPSAAYGYCELIKEDNGMVCRLPINYQRRSEKFGGKEFFPVKSFTEAVIDAHRRFQGVGPASEFLPASPDRPFYINFSSANYPVLSMRQVLNGNFDKDILKNKIVLIGSTLTPRAGDPQNVRTPNQENIPEVMIEAGALSCLLANQVILSLPRWLIHLVLVVMGASFGALFSSVPMGKRLLFISTAAVAVIVSTQIAFQVFNLALPLAAPLAVLGSVFVIGTFIFLDTDLRLSNSELAQARKSMQVRAEEERRRIAEDLHDETLPTLSTVARLADQLSQQLPENQVPGLMRTKLDSAVSEMRRVINDLHPSVIETMGFVPALENLVTMLAHDTGIEGKFANGDSSDEYGLSDFAKLQLYRMVQEAVNNIEKHSHATYAAVSISRQGDQLLISVIDNGRGFDKGEGKLHSYGLVNIRQRAQLIGAQVDWLRPEKFGHGTEVRIRVPLANAGQVRVEGQ